MSIVAGRLLLSGSQCLLGAYHAHDIMLEQIQPVSYLHQPIWQVAPAGDVQ